MEIVAKPRSESLVQNVNTKRLGGACGSARVLHNMTLAPTRNCSSCFSLLSITR